MSLQGLIIGLFIGIEVFLIISVKLLRKDFQWLITSKDERPYFDPKGLKSFISKSFDPTLGWVRKKNSTGIEKGEKRKIYFKIDEIGSRVNSNTGKHIPTIACFGDSYAFCRQVDNDETWEYFLSESLKTGVINFGVGNYGLDQALIRYKNTDLPSSINTVVMAVVPETICRIQSYWKHYLEFGNTFAFKPKFIFKNGHLILQENMMRNEKDFSNYQEKLSHIQSNDRFYKEKFRKFQFRFPYTFSFFRNLNRNTKLFYALFKRSIKRIIGQSNNEIEDQPFRYIMENNIELAHKLYEEKHSKDLFYALVNDFINHAISRNHKPLFILLPQLIDFHVINKTGLNLYSAFISNIDIPGSQVLDFTKPFSKLENLGEYYVNDKYGGHISKKGNEYIANILTKKLDKYY
jgi:hypothetical protein